jgi:hypothetical protein
MAARRELTMNTAVECHSFLDVLGTIYCDVGKERNIVPGEERVSFWY